MNQTINNICKVEVARKSEISEYYETPTGLAVIAAPWSLVPLKSNARININKALTRSGDRWDVSFSAPLKTVFQEDAFCVVRVFFDDGSDPLLIGSPDFPVKLIEDHSNNSKRLDFSHSLWRYPLRVSAESLGSGSSSS